MAPASSRFRSLEQIRDEHEQDPLVVNLVTVLHEKLNLASRYALYEYEAVRAGSDLCAGVFSRMAIQDREQINELLAVLTGHLTSAKGQGRRIFGASSAGVTG